MRWEDLDVGVATAYQYLAYSLHEALQDPKHTVCAARIRVFSTAALGLSEEHSMWYILVRYHHLCEAWIPGVRGFSSRSPR